MKLLIIILLFGCNVSKNKPVKMGTWDRAIYGGSITPTSTNLPLFTDGASQTIFNAPCDLYLRINNCPILPITLKPIQ